MHRTLINDIISDRKEIGMASALLQEISKDERERAKFRSRRMYETDRISDLLTAEEKGEKRGERNERKKMMGVLAKKDVEIAENKAQLNDKDKEIARLRAELEKRK